MQSATNEMAENLSAAILNQDDPETVRDGAPAYLLMLDSFIDHHHLYGEHMRFTFSQAAPGLLCCAYRLDLLHEMVLSGLPFGDILAYNPDHPHPDFIVHESTYMLDAALSDWQFRCLADNHRSFDIFEKIFQNLVRI